MKGTVVVNTDSLTRKTTVETSPTQVGSRKLADLAANMRSVALVTLWGACIVLVVAGLTRTIVWILA